jgi:hypothetical protein
LWLLFSSDTEKAGEEDSVPIALQGSLGSTGD